MSRYSQLSATIARGKAVIDRLESDLAQVRNDPVRVREKNNQLRRARADLTWLKGQLEALTETAEG